MEKMNIYRIKTTAFEEEDFFLMTTLTQRQVTNAITPIVMAEREGEEYYDNDTLTDAVKQKHPNAEVIQMIEIESITI